MIQRFQSNFQFKSTFFEYFFFDYPKSRLKKMLSPFLLGLMLSFAFQPHNYTILGFLSLLLFYRHFEKRMMYSAENAFSIGYWYGFGYFAGGLYWIAYALHIDWLKYAVLIPLAALGIPAVLALGLGLSTFVAARLKAFGRLVPLLGFVLTWSLFEWVKGHLLTGFPWLNMAEIWLSGDVMIQNLAFMGPYGLGLLTLLLFVLLYGVIFFERVYRSKFFIAFLALSTVLLINGKVHLTQEPQRQYTNFDLVIVQPNILQIHKWAPDRLRFNIDTLVRLSQQSRLQPQLGTKYKPKIFIWPEASVPYLIQSGTAFSKYITQPLEPGDYLILGAPRHDALTDRHFNSLLVLDHEGQILKTYDKTHLVPFGEYVPYRNVLPSFVEQLAPGDHEYSPGEGIKTLDVPGIPTFSPLICYEAIFTQEVLTETNGERPKWLLNLTNDGWYLDSAGIYQHLHLTRMRAIEEGIPLVRVVYRGISAVFDGNGRMTSQIPFDEAQGLVTQLPRSLENRTFYSIYGSSLYVLMLLLLGLFMLCLTIYSIKSCRKVSL